MSRWALREAFLWTADGRVAGSRDPSWQSPLPSIPELAFLCGFVYPKLFGYSCFELQDKSRQTDKKLPLNSGDPSLPPRNPQATPPGGVTDYAIVHPQVRPQSP